MTFKGPEKSNHECGAPCSNWNNYGGNIDWLNNYFGQCDPSCKVFGPILGHLPQWPYMYRDEVKWEQAIIILISSQICFIVSKTSFQLVDMSRDSNPRSLSWKSSIIGFEFDRSIVCDGQSKHLLTTFEPFPRREGKAKFV